MKNKNNITSEHVQFTECSCKSTQGLFVPRRQLTFLVVMLGLVVLCTGTIGFYCGKWVCAHELGKLFDREAFVDKVYASVFSFPADESETDLESEVDLENEGMYTQEDNGMNIDETAKESPIVTNVDAGEQEKSDGAIVAPTTDDLIVPCYAEIAGFRTEQSARAYQEHLSQKGYPVVMKKRISETCRGNKKVWYQVVTDTFEKVELLEEVVEKIMLSERLKDKIRIVYS